MRTAIRWIRHLFEAWGAVALLVSAGLGTVVGAVAAAVMSIPWPLRLLVFAGVVLIVMGLALGAVNWWRSRDAGGLSGLADEIEALVGEGFRVQDFIQSGPIPSNGKPSEETVDRAHDFRERCLDLLRDSVPTLVRPFADAGNAYRRENSGPRSTNDLREAFAGMAWDGLLLDVQANMCGLEAAQEELGRRLDRQRPSRSRSS